MRIVFRDQYHYDLERNDYGVDKFKERPRKKNRFFNNEIRQLWELDPNKMSERFFEGIQCVALNWISLLSKLTLLNLFRILFNFDPFYPVMAVNLIRKKLLIFLVGSDSIINEFKTLSLSQ